MTSKRLNGKASFDSFGNTFRSIYRPAATSPLEKNAAAGLRATDAISGFTAGLGHPEYINLQAGESRTGRAAVSFIDIRGFTKLSFVLEPEELLRIVQALTKAAINVISDGGGYIGEFTGDGVMAYFGDSTTDDESSAIAALETTSLLFKTVEEIVNPELESDGIDPIRIAAGMEWGEVLWSRVGAGAASQIKPIANATFLAGKLSSSKYTKAWECKIGEHLARWIPDEYLTKAPQFGPFSAKGTSISHGLFLLDWRQLASDTLQDQDRMEDRFRQRASMSRAGLLAASKITTPATSGPSPRPLKDQPFFSR